MSSALGEYSLSEFWEEMNYKERTFGFIYDSLESSVNRWKRP